MEERFDDSLNGSDGFPEQPLTFERQSNLEGLPGHVTGQSQAQYVTQNVPLWNERVPVGQEGFHSLQGYQDQFQAANNVHEVYNIMDAQRRSGV